MSLKRNLILSFALMGIFGYSSNLSAHDVTATSPIVSENFNSMWDDATASPKLSLPAGWKIEANKSGVRTVGSWENASGEVLYSGGPDLPSNAKNGTWNFGPLNNDRAVGGFTTTVADGTRAVNLMTKLTNTDVSNIITNVTLDYNIEKYRTCANEAGFAVSIFTSYDGIKWTNAGDQFTTIFEKETATAEGASIVPISTEIINGRTIRVHVEPGKDLFIAWNISVATGSSPDKAPGLAIDDIKLTATFAATDPDWEENEEPEINHSGIYLRGIDGVWDATPEWEFNKISETEFEIKNRTISGTFKVADANWSSSCNYGSNGSNIMMGEPYTLKSGVDTNISCGSYSFNCSRILLTIENGVATLLLEPNEDSTGLTTVYMVGDFNGWNYMNTSGALKLDASDNLFKGQVSLSAGESGLSEWMIYQRLGMAGAWGLETDATVPSLSGTLVKGEKGHVVSEAATYDVTFNLQTGDYTLTKLSASISEISLSPSETILVPVVPDEVKVLSLNNSLIHYNDQAKIFNEIAQSQGKKATWTKHTNLGKTLEYHWNEGDGMTDAGLPGAKMMVRSDSWSHIILQEQSALPRTDIEKFRSNVKMWVDYIRDNCPNPNAVIILPMNWHFAQDWSNFNEFNEIQIKNFTEVATDLGVVVCPIAVAYGNKFAKDGGEITEAEWFLPGDDRHPTIRSSYMAALMEYGLIFNEDPTSVTYYPTYTTDYDENAINAEIAADMRQYAHDALNQYKNTVNHHEGTIDFKLRLLDDFGMEVKADEIEWTVEPSTASITEGVFRSKENGEYTVTAKSAGFTDKAVVKVADAVTEMIEIPSIELNPENLEYTQNFNEIGDAADATLPQGWRIDRTDAPRAVGTFRGASEQTTYAGGVNLASNAKNGVYNFGASDDNNDRAVGGITTGVEGGTRAVNAYAHFVNGCSRKITDFEISYDIEKYRDGNNAAGYTVKLYTSVDGINWEEAGEDFITVFPASSATAGAPIVPIETKSANGSFSRTLVSGADLYLAWNISVSNGSDCSGAPALALDNVSIKATLAEIPVYDYYIYIANETDYDSKALYAWGDKEIWGSWPGQIPFDVLNKDGYTFDVFGHNEASGSYSLIYNNNNQGSQLGDYKIEGGRDYYFVATPAGLSELNIVSIEQLEDNGLGNILFSNESITCKNASNISIYSLNGTCISQTERDSLSVKNLSKGFYIIVAKNNQLQKTLKFIKK